MLPIEGTNSGKSHCLLTIAKITVSQIQYKMSQWHKQSFKNELQTIKVKYKFT